jgi:hypothetical protein
MKGYILEFKPHDKDSRIRLYHMIFGRNVYRDYRGKKYAYYSPGMLDNTPYCNLIERKIFVTSLTNIYLPKLRILGIITVSEVERDYPMEKLYTGEDYWRSVAEEKGLEFKRRLRTRKTTCKAEMGQKGML